MTLTTTNPAEITLDTSNTAALTAYLKGPALLPLTDEDIDRLEAREMELENNLDAWNAAQVNPTAYTLPSVKPAPRFDDRGRPTPTGNSGHYDAASDAEPYPTADTSPAPQVYRSSTEDPRPIWKPSKADLDQAARLLTGTYDRATLETAQAKPAELFKLGQDISTQPALLGLLAGSRPSNKTTARIVAALLEM